MNGLRLCRARLPMSWWSLNLKYDITTQNKSLKWFTVSGRSKQTYTRARVQWSHASVGLRLAPIMQWYSHELVMVFLLDLMSSITTNSKAAIKIITTMPKAATTPLKTPTFKWVPTKGWNHMHYIILKLMCIITHARGSKKDIASSPGHSPPRPGDQGKKDTIPNLQLAVKVVVWEAIT